VVSVAIYLFFVFLLLQNKRRRQQHFKMGFFTSTAAGQQPMDKTSENGWMMQSFLLSLHLMSTTPIQPLPELPGIVVQHSLSR
jgi:hypothetical protein